MSWIIEKYRKEAWDSFNKMTDLPTWREAILESIFRPKMVLPPGKGPMTHLHPDLDKLHMPHGVKIADWRKYRVEDHPALIEHQKRCHAVGLHDPWLRNHAFNFYPNIKGTRSRMAFFTRGFSFGFCAALTLYLGEKIYDQFYPTEYEHSEEYLKKYGHGGGGHH